MNGRGLIKTVEGACTGAEESMLENLFSDDDLKDILEEYEEGASGEEVEDPELEASQRRYNDIIKKHKNE